jgi:hypothetical protein
MDAIHSFVLSLMDECGGGSSVDNELTESSPFDLAAISDERLLHGDSEQINANVMQAFASYKLCIDSHQPQSQSTDSPRRLCSATSSACRCHLYRMATLP